MSIRIMTAVWGLKLSSTDKLVLLALADNASDEGACYPSVATLLKKCSLGERTVRRVIGSLAEAGHITCHERQGRSTVYTVHPCQDGTPVVATPLPQRHPTPATAAPIIIREPSVESSREPAARSRSTLVKPNEFEQRVIGSYHSALPDSPSVAAWNKTRRQLLQSRVADAKARGKLDADTPEYWHRFFTKVSNSEFLTGKAKGDRPFVANLEWLLRPTNYLKVVEGNYDR